MIRASRKQVHVGQSRREEKRNPTQKTLEVQLVCGRLPKFGPNQILIEQGWQTSFYSTSGISESIPFLSLLPQGQQGLLGLRESKGHFQDKC